MRLTFENRYFRHGIFWIFWVLGFTCIKSFGASFDIYLAWLVYYVLTLPVFVLHTYLVVYWLGRKFLSGYRMILFVFLFLILMCSFSFLELIITDELLSGFFPGIFPGTPSYMDPVNILVSGVGNLYIILVFAAAKMVRSWHISQNHKQGIMEQNLHLERADVNAGIQPGLLLFSIEHIEQLAQAKSEEVPAKIATLSEIMNAAMQARKNLMIRVDEELYNLKRLLNFYSGLLSFELPKIRIEGENLSMKMLPSFILFSPLEILFRKLCLIPEGNILITIEEAGKVEISWESERIPMKNLDVGPVNEELNRLYPGRFSLLLHNLADHFSIQIEAK